MKICFVGENPETVGGMSLFQRNLIDYLKNNEESFDITWIHRSDKDKEEVVKGIKYVGISLPAVFLLKDIIFNKKVKRYLEKNYFDIVNSHAIWGNWMKSYKKKKIQKLINTYHGTTYYFYKNHMGRFGCFKKMLYSPLLVFGYFYEKFPMKKADKIICVSDKVKKQVEDLYGKRKNIFVVRTGVDLKEFKLRKKDEVRVKLNLDEKKFYGLYIGGGGYWTKGLDRVVSLGKEIFRVNKDFRLLVIGPNYEKVGHFLKEPFIIFLENITREKMPFYYSASDIFFCMSRYEGGAPTLVVSEAMASGCLLVCSKDSEQEIIKDKENGLIISEFGKKDAKKILEVYKNKKLTEKIIKNSFETVKDLSLEKWGGEYLKILKD